MLNIVKLFVKFVPHRGVSTVRVITIVVRLFFCVVFQIQENCAYPMGFDEPLSAVELCIDPRI